MLTGHVALGSKEPTAWIPIKRLWNPRSFDEPIRFCDPNAAYPLTYLVTVQLYLLLCSSNLIRYTFDYIYNTYEYIIDWNLQHYYQYVNGNDSSANDIEFALIKPREFGIRAVALEVGKSGPWLFALDQCEHQQHSHDQKTHSFRLHSSFTNELPQYKNL